VKDDRAASIHLSNSTEARDNTEASVSQSFLYLSGLSRPREKIALRANERALQHFRYPDNQPVADFSNRIAALDLLILASAAFASSKSALAFAILTASVSTRTLPSDSRALT